MTTNLVTNLATKEYFIDGALIRTRHLHSQLMFRANVVYCFTDKCFIKNRYQEELSESKMRSEGIPSEVIAASVIKYRIQHRLLMK